VGSSNGSNNPADGPPGGAYDFSTTAREWSHPIVYLDLRQPTVCQQAGVMADQTAALRLGGRPLGVESRH